MKAMVVDDEAPARRRLMRLIARIPDVEVTTEAATASQALEGIRRTSPDVIFLDIQMPGMDGLAVAEQCADVPAVVFVTAHAEHAARAFELDTVDYLLKPVRFERLEEALRRVRGRRRRASQEKSAEAEPLPVVVHERGATMLVEVARLTRFSATDKYVAFRSGDRELLTEESLASLEARLAPCGFVRVHRAELVRLSAVEAFMVQDGAHSLRLRDGQIVPVSRRLAAQLRERLER